MEEALATITEVLEIVIVPLLAIELWWLRRQGELRWNTRIKEMLTNVSSLLFLLPGAAIGLVCWSWLFHKIAAVVPWSIPANWGTALLAVLGADFIYYWEHRFEHEHRLPWDLWHSVHHSGHTYDQTTSLRLGFFDGLLTTGFSVPLVLAGFTPTFALAATAVVIGYQTWIHTETIRRLPRWFEYVFNTASHHRAHHGADEHYLDVNYGAVLILWDRMFGTFQVETNRPDYGLTTQIESSHPLDVQFSQLKLLWRDLRNDTSWSIRLTRLWKRPGWQAPAAA